MTRTQNYIILASILFFLTCSCVTGAEYDYFEQQCNTKKKFGELVSKYHEQYEADKKKVDLLLKKPSDEFEIFRFELSEMTFNFQQRMGDCIQNNKMELANLELKYTNLYDQLMDQIPQIVVHEIKECEFLSNVTKFYYQIKDEDTITDMLAKFNGLKDKNRLMEGRKMKLPPLWYNAELHIPRTEPPKEPLAEAVCFNAKAGMSISQVDQPLAVEIKKQELKNNPESDLDEIGEEVKEEKFKEAIEQYMKALKYDPGNEETFRGLYLVYWNRGMEYYKKMFEDDAQREQNKNIAGLAFQKAAEYKPECSYCQKKEIDRLHMELSAVKHAWDEDQYDAIEKPIELILLINKEWESDDVKKYHALATNMKEGLALFRRYHYGLAKPYFKAVADIDSTKLIAIQYLHRCYFENAIAYYKRGKDNEAEKELKQAYQIRDGLLRKYKCGKKCNKTRDCDELFQSVKKCINPCAKYETNFKKNSYYKAKRDIEKGARTLNMNYFHEAHATSDWLSKLDHCFNKDNILMYQYTQGLNYINKQKWKAAKVIFQNIHSQNRTFKDTEKELSYSKALWHLQENRLTEAKSRLDQISRKNPGFRDTELAKEYAKGCIQLQNRQVEDAIKTFEAIQKKKKNFLNIAEKLKKARQTLAQS